MAVSHWRDDEGLAAEQRLAEAGNRDSRDRLERGFPADHRPRVRHGRSFEQVGELKT